MVHQKGRGKRKRKAKKDCCSIWPGTKGAIFNIIILTHCQTICTRPFLLTFTNTWELEVVVTTQKFHKTEKLSNYLRAYVNSEQNPSSGISDNGVQLTLSVTKGQFVLPAYHNILHTVKRISDSTETHAKCLMDVGRMNPVQT